jgi:hypothetical protein
MNKMLKSLDVSSIRHFPSPSLAIAGVKHAIRASDASLLLVAKKWK